MSKRKKAIYAMVMCFIALYIVYDLNSDLGNKTSKQLKQSSENVKKVHIIDKTVEPYTIKTLASPLRDISKMKIENVAGQYSVKPYNTSTPTPPIPNGVAISMPPNLHGVAYKKAISLKGLINADTYAAIIDINGNVVTGREGEIIDGYVIQNISNNSVTVSSPEGQPIVLNINRGGE